MNAHEWNAAYPVGTHVRVILADGVAVTTKTRSIAQTWNTLDHIRVDAISQGYIPLDWVLPLVPPFAS
jgi:hypothetical protein